MAYDQIAHAVKIGGTVFFFIFLVLVLIYALWPKNGKAFKEAANLALNEDKPSPDNAPKTP